MEERPLMSTLSFTKRTLHGDGGRASSSSDSESAASASGRSTTTPDSPACGQTHSLNSCSRKLTISQRIHYIKMETFTRVHITCSPNRLFNVTHVPSYLSTRSASRSGRVRVAGPVRCSPVHSHRSRAVRRSVECGVFR